MSFTLDGAYGTPSVDNDGNPYLVPVGKKAVGYIAVDSVSNSIVQYATDTVKSGGVNYDKVTQ
jgi:hypothetical protein